MSIEITTPAPPSPGGTCAGCDQPGVLVGWRAEAEGLFLCPDHMASWTDESSARFKEERPDDQSLTGVARRAFERYQVDHPEDPTPS